MLASAYVLLKKESIIDSLHRDPVRNKLFEILKTNFSLSELQDLAFELGIDFDVLEGVGKNNKVRELITYAMRHEQLQELIEICLRSRPKADWWDSPENIRNKLQTRRSHHSISQFFKYSPLVRKSAVIGIVLPIILTFLIGLFWPTLVVSSLPFAPEQVDETLIVIATFHRTEGIEDSEVQREIRRGIRDAAEDINLSSLRTEIDPSVLRSYDRVEAETLGHLYDASIIIWGEENGVRVTINYLNLKKSAFEADEQEISVTKPSDYSQLFTEDLPGQITFLSLFAIGQSYLANEDYTQAAIIIEKAVSSLKTNLISPNSLAEAYFQLGWIHHVPFQNSKLAIENYSRAIANGDNFIFAYYNRGLAYLAEENFALAIEDFDAIESQLRMPVTERVRLLELRGDSLIGLGKFQQAEEAYLQAIKLDSDDARAKNALAWFYTETFAEESEKVDRAIELAQEAINLTLKDGKNNQTDLATYKDTLGWAYFRRGEINLAEETLHEAFEHCQLGSSDCKEIETHINLVISAK